MRGAAFEPAGPRRDSPGTAPSPRMTDASCPSAPRTACLVAREATPPIGLSAINQSAADATPLAEPPACIAGLTPGRECHVAQVCAEIVRVTPAQFVHQRLGGLARR